MTEQYPQFSKMVAKLTCLRVVDQTRYEVICWFYTFVDPLCLFIFIVFLDRLMDFKTRFIAEYDRNAIEIRHFTIRAGNIPNQKFIKNELGKDVT